MAPTNPAAKTAVQNADGEAADIPLHLTEKVLHRISPLESARFLTVCKSWASTIFSRLARPIPHLFALQASAAQAGEAPRRRGAIFSLPIDGSNNELDPVMPAKLPVMPSHAYANHMRLSGALPSGCVSFAMDAVGSNHAVLVNPVTGAAQSVEVHGTTPSGAPPKVRAVAGAEAFLVSEFGDEGVSIRWRRDGEQQWRARKLPIPHKFSFSSDAFDLVAYTDFAFYAMEYFGFTFVVSTRAPPHMARLDVPSILEQYTPICGPAGFRFLQSCYMLVSEGEVLFVGPVLDGNKAVGGFEMFRLDVQGGRWVKVERLAGDRALFVSEQSSFSVRASETPGCRSNCIYFVTELGDKCSNGICNWGVYSMEEDKVLFQSSVGSPGLDI
ncbi:hypothetical protein BRADI_1g48988v3 [Brachypodium distachyon]|uniref:KIB1-4 beta-propeller domain-containing protein n=1 Tax=Brachypodium distachyon TaxID=15368 RepID=A0A0Q3H9G7_BRADI|nr:hypothetical protein BRADI_1g48988v3 [Brachypodium distachyon]